MTYNLKVVNGLVRFCMKTGNDFVLSHMTEESARRIIKEKMAIADNSKKGFPIKADKYYFEGTIQENKVKKKKAPKEDELQ